MAHFPHQALLVCGLIFCLPSGFPQTFTVNHPANIVAWNGSCALIPCKCSHPSYEITTFKWIHSPYFNDSTKEYEGNIVYSSINHNEVSSSFKDRVPSREKQEKDCTIVITNLQENDSGSYGFRIWTNVEIQKWIQEPYLHLNVSDQAPDFKIEDIRMEMKESEEAKVTCSVNYYCPEYQVNLAWIADLNVSSTTKPPRKQNNDLSTKSILTFLPSWRDHNKTIECVLTRGNTYVITERRQLLLNVQYAPKDVKILNENHTLEIIEGEQIHLRCTAHSSNPPVNRYTWYNTKKSDIGKQEKLVVKESETYYCEAGNNMGSAQSTSVTINVLYAPKNVRIVKNNERIKETDHVTLNCYASANPSVVYYTWYKDKKIYVNQTVSKITFPSIKESDSGSYECEANNKLGSKMSLPVKVDVMYSPRLPEVIIKPKGHIFIEGTDVKLTCYINSSNPEITKIVWYKMENYIKGAKEIQFQTIKAKDSGRYVCEACNIIGCTKSESVDINVHYPPKGTHVKIKNLTFQEGEPALLTCYTNQSEPKISGYQWFKDKRPYQNQRERLTFDSIQWTDSGAYACEARNTIGSGMSEPVEISILYGPKNLNISVNPSKSVTEYMDISLICSAKANPPELKYFWYRDNIYLKREKSQLFLRNIQRSDSGAYYCKASNDIGTVESQHLELHVSYSSTTIIKYVAAGSGILILLIVTFLALRFKVWKKIYHSEGDKSESSFFVLKKSENNIRQNPSANSSTEELNYSVVHAVPSFQKRTRPQRTDVRPDDPAVIYSVVMQSCSGSQVNEYENVEPSDIPKAQNGNQDDIHYSTIAHLPKMETALHRDNEIEYAMLRH
ncbi:B-cell receptor CD22 [Bombina bombina]|uniref:B-cell receptor CD22 n=1 Tax=Bombina bombina TaxID=8345 RepID=UPI00235A51A4|nr:B-cell receptor CD22 [Bombina bombina]